MTHAFDDSPPGAFTAPFTSSGRAALVPRPPWHYAGWLINVGFDGATDRSAELVPAAVGRLTGRGCIHFADWQACTDGRELLDPVYAQYRETIVIVEVERPDGTPGRYCPFIYVDQDISLLRGWLQGWPKKFGSTWLTRSLPLQHPAAAPLAARARLGASLSVKERRLIDAQIRLDGSPAQRMGLLAGPTIGAVGWPDLRQPAAATAPRFVRADIVDRVESEWLGAEARLQLHAHPVEELALLGELRATVASAGWLGITVRGALDA
jgi:hypothetical protein